MRTRIIRIDPSQPDSESLREAARVLRVGGLVAFPTETVYGLGGNALDAQALRRIFAAKGRPASNPLIAHGHSLQAFEALIREPSAALSRLARFWPGPLTLVVPARASAPRELSAGRGTVALRIPHHPVALALLEAAGFPVAAPSANAFTRPSPTRAEHVLEDLMGKVDLVLDAGATPLGVESTVVDLTAEPPRLLRPGALAFETLREALPTLRVQTSMMVDVDEASEALPGPGLLRRHYSPKAPMTVFVGPVEGVHEALMRIAEPMLQAGRRVGLLATEAHCRALRAFPFVVQSLGPDDHLDIAAARLFACLRAFDAAQVDFILAVGFDPSGWGRALQDRLIRAANGEIVEVSDV